MRPVGIRPLEAEDADELRELFGRLSPESVQLRFFQPVRAPTDATLRHLAAVDHLGREAIAAVEGDHIVGVARYERDVADPTKAEVAIVVEDDRQGQGLGTLLLFRIAERARQAGVETFTASVLGGNVRMLALARKLSPNRRTHLDHGEWELEMPLPAS